MYSDWDCTLEGLPHPPAVRLGLRLISSPKQALVDRLMIARAEAVFESAEDLARRAGLDQPEMKLLAGADALMSLSGHRGQQVREASALRATPKLLRDAPVNEDYLELPLAPEGEEKQPDTANGTIFVSLEDETRVCSGDLPEADPRASTHAAIALAVDGCARHLAARGRGHEPHRGKNRGSDANAWQAR